MAGSGRGWGRLEEAERAATLLGEAFSASVMPALLASSEEKGLLEAVWRLASFTLVAGECRPRYPTAQLDGCAVKASSVAKGAVLRVAGRLRPGSEPSKLVNPGSECVWVDTGAPLPRGADSVVPLEELELKGDTVRLLSEPRAFRGVAGPCSDASQGDPLISQGSVLTPNSIASLASLGYGGARVSRALRACIASIGDELVEPGSGGGGVYESNRYQLSARLSKLGIEVEDLGIIPDEPSEIRRVLEKALRLGCDLIMTSGGSSVGLSDYASDVIGSGRPIFSGVKIRPGRPTRAGIHGGRILVMLPGHPRSAAAALEEVVLRGLALGGAPMAFSEEVEARILSSYRAGDRRVRLPVALYRCGGGLVALPVARESYMTLSWSTAEGEAVIDAGSEVGPGDRVRVKVFRRPRPRPVIDVADTSILTLAGSTAAKVDLRFRLEILNSLWELCGNEALVIGEEDDVDGEEVFSRPVGLVARESLEACRTLALPDLPSARTLVGQLGAKPEEVVVTGRIGSARALVEEGYVDCAVIPGKSSPVSTASSRIVVSGFSWKR